MSLQRMKDMIYT